MPAPRKTIPRASQQAPIRKRYTAIIRDDGSLLPVEERIGRRLLRTLSPGSGEAQELLLRGEVSLVTSTGARLEGTPLREVYSRLDAASRSRLATHADDPAWRAACRSALRGLRLARRRLDRDH